MDFSNIPFSTVLEAAQTGDTEALFQVGVCYAHGYGVAQDFKAAAEWFEKAAVMGHMQAQDRLGVCYATGHGVSQNDQEAVKWFRRASEQGNPVAQFNLGLALVLGQGVEPDSKEAYLWFSLSAAQGDLMAMESRTRVAEQMTGRELIEAEEAVKKRMDLMPQFNFSGSFT